MSNLLRRVFYVYIHTKKRWVFDIPDKEHEGHDGVPKTWWLYLGDIYNEQITPPADSPDFVPYTYSINRRNWDIRIKQGNTTKEKWGETQFRKHTHVEMRCNERLVYSFSTIGGSEGLSYAFAKIQYLKVQMEEHPFNFFDPEEEEGRKIYWHGLPATVRLKSHPGEIAIIPDYTCGLDKEAWWKELNRRKTLVPKKNNDFAEIDEEHDNEAKNEDYINWGDALSDKYIDWFRK